MTTEMELVVDAGGDVRGVYGEELDLRDIGRLSITRASHVEPDAEGYWFADMGPVDGPVLGLFTNRTKALEVGSGCLSSVDEVRAQLFPEDAIAELTVAGRFRCASR